MRRGEEEGSEERCGRGKSAEEEKIREQPEGVGFLGGRKAERKQKAQPLPHLCVCNFLNSATTCISVCVTVHAFLKLLHWEELPDIKNY